MSYAKQFYVCRLEEVDKIAIHQQQTGYHAISLIAGNTPEATTMLRFCNPQGPQAGDPLPKKHAGFACFFSTAFLSTRMHDMLQSLPMFKKGTSPVYFLNPAQGNHMRRLFEKMLEEVNNNYTFKYELLGNYLATIIHQVLKIQPAIRE